MKGFISITIPTKSYIKAYLISRFGENITLQKGEDNISNKLYDLLQHSTNERKEQFSLNTFPTTVKVYINAYTFRTRGHCLNETNIIQFNKFIELEIKDKFYFMMDFFTDILPSFEANIDIVRSKLKIDEQYWSTDSLKKDYYRYRKKKGLKLFYKK